MSYNFSKFSGKKVLVTGATGFIGPHLCNKLAASGAKVIGVSRKKEINKSIFTDGIKYLNVNFSKSKAVKSFFNKHKPDFVFHLAGLAAGSRDVELIKPTFKSNLVTTINVLLAVNDLKNTRLIVVGSMEEPDAEERDFVPSSPYSASKWAATNYAQMFHQLYKTNLVIARLFMTYGPGNQPEKKLLPYVINSLLDGVSPKLSSGSRNIDWIYIDDVINGLLTVALCPDIEGKTIDIGNGLLVTTREFVETIRKVIGSNIELLFGQLEERTKEQVKKAQIEITFDLTGWKPTIQLEEGLRQTVNWYKEQRKIT